MQFRCSLWERCDSDVCIRHILSSSAIFLRRIGHISSANSFYTWKKHSFHNLFLPHWIGDWKRLLFSSVMICHPFFKRLEKRILFTGLKFMCFCCISTKLWKDPSPIASSSPPINELPSGIIASTKSWNFIWSNAIFLFFEKGFYDKSCALII